MNSRAVPATTSFWKRVCSSLEQRCVAGDRPRFQERGAHRHVVARRLQRLVHRARRVADLQPQVPEHVEDVFGHALRPGGLLPGKQEQEVDVGVRAPACRARSRRPRPATAARPPRDCSPERRASVAKSNSASMIVSASAASRSAQRSPWPSCSSRVRIDAAAVRQHLLAEDRAPPCAPPANRRRAPRRWRRARPSARSRRRGFPLVCSRCT